MSSESRLKSFLGRVKNVFSPSEERSFSTMEFPWMKGVGVPPTFSPEVALKSYDDNVYLHRSVKTIAYQLGAAKIRLRYKDAEAEEVLDHVALKTLRFPQPTKAGKSMLTGMDLRILTGMNMMLPGEAFWLLDRRMKMGGAPTFIQPLPTQYMFPNPSDDGTVMEYTFRSPTQERKLDPLDVVHFKIIDPMNMYRGHSPIQPIRYAVDTHKKADQMNTRKLDNHSVPAGVLQSEQPIGEAERTKIGQQWQSAFGGIKNSGKTPVLPQGLKYERIGESNQEMQFIEGKNVVRDEILAAYGVGLEILGKTESQTRANAEAAIFVFMKFGVLPFLAKFVDTLNNDYLPAFPGTEDLEFTFDDPVPENMEEKRATADSLFNGGALTPNERRKMFGLEALELPGMDSTYLDMGKVAVDEPDPVVQDDPLAV